MISPKVFILFAFCALLSYGSYAQILDFVDIHLTILEKDGNETKVLPNANLNIKGIGQVETNSMGRYDYKYSINQQQSPELSIEMLSKEHKVLKPLDGNINIDPSRTEMFIEFVVVNMSEEPAAFQKQINDLESKVSSLRSKNELTKQQLSKLNNVLVDTILHFEAIRNSMAYQIDNLQEMSQDQAYLLEQQRQKIDSLEQKVYGLSLELTLALEKKYLRQNDYFKTIAANFSKYTRAANDVTEHLGHIKSYFNTNDFRSLDRDLRLYEEAFTAIADNHQDQIAGVDRYWEAPQVTRELESIYDLLLKGIHLKQIRPTWNEILGLIGKQKPAKAQKLANEAAESMILNLRDLEKKINQVLIKMRNS